jgi:hypothetical protein
VSAWLVTFALTLVVELAIALPLLGLVEPRWKKRIALVVLANVVTHPIVYVLAGTLRSHAAIPILEVTATLVEAAIYARVFGARPVLPSFGASALANAGSLLASIIFWVSRG